MKPAFPSRHRALALLLTTVALLATWTGAGQTLEAWGYRAAGWFAPEKTAAPRVAVIALQPTTAAGLRRQAAEALQRLRALGAGPVALLLPLAHPANPQGLAALRQAAAKLRAQDRQHTAPLLNAVENLDVDGRLAQALANARNVIVAAFPARGSGPTSTDRLSRYRLPPRSARRDPLQSIVGFVLDPATTPLHLVAPLASIRASAAGLGVAPTWHNGAMVTAVQLWVRDGNSYLPGVALALAAAVQHRNIGAVTLRRASVRVGTLNIPVGPGGRFYPLPLANGAAHQRIVVHSLATLLSGAIPGRTLHGRPVLVGIDSGADAPVLRGPAGGRWTPLTWTAQSLAALLNGQSVRVPFWSTAAQRGGVLLVGLCLILLPWRLRGRLGLILGAVVAVALLNAGLLVLITQKLWLPLLIPAVFLFGGQLLLGFNHRTEAALRAARNDAAHARRQLGLNLQNQGLLDAAQEQFEACVNDPSVDESLYQLGLEFERRRQFPKALALYQKLEQADPQFHDVARRRAHLETLTAHLPGAAVVGGGTATVALDHPAVEKPVIGRYHIERLLGQGAMGAVYLAQDPDIGRAVAVKALPLAEEFQGAALQEARGRLKREVEAAGRLKHPNIVTVHDVGEERDLAYIAMDYAEGRSLVAWTEPDTLLAVDDALYVCAEVAEALHYAHARKVVHRDIKPGNVIYDPASGAVKVSDFGVASLMDDRKTRTGTVLGSPAYMSPEQITGTRIDGRSDLFSLGVTLYQLLTGQLPFKGDSVANLAYRITQEKHANLGRVRRGLPACASRIVNKALQKDPGDRYASGADMAAALRRCGGARAARRRK